MLSKLLCLALCAELQAACTSQLRSCHLLIHTHLLGSPLNASELLSSLCVLFLVPPPSRRGGAGASGGSGGARHAHPQPLRPAGVCCDRPGLQCSVWTDKCRWVTGGVA